MVKNLKDLMKRFQDEETCRQLLIQQRWGGNPVCPYCGHNKAYNIEHGKRFKCANQICYKKFSVTVGTVFHASNIPLTTWFPAMYLIASHKKGISSCQLARDLGVTQKTAWFMLHRIREALKSDYPFLLGNLSGTVEVDETYVGGKMKNKHKSVRAKYRDMVGSNTFQKTPVMGIIERGGKVKLEVIDYFKTSLKDMVKKNVDKSAMLITDSLSSYKGLDKHFRAHEIIQHDKNEYVVDFVHTNTIEGCFSLLKRGIIGIYHQVSAKHLSRYCDEFSYRYNTRKIKDGDRFHFVSSNLEGRLSYKTLVYGEGGKKEESQKEG